MDNWCFVHHYTARQCQCCTTATIQEEEEQEEETRNYNSSTRIHVMASRCSKNVSPIICIFVFFLFSVCPVLSLETQQFNLSNHTFKPGDDMKIIKSHLMKVNKPSLKTIQVFTISSFFSNLILSYFPVLIISLNCCDAES